MPLKLQGLLAMFGVRLAELARHLECSHTTVTQIVSRDVWPRRLDQYAMRREIEMFLRERGATEIQIQEAFEINDGPDRPRSTRQSFTRVGRALAPTAQQIQPEKEMLTQDAKQHFKLFRDPFQHDVQGPEDVYLARGQHYVREAMFQAARHGGFLAVVGESGAGKSVLRRDLIDRIQRDHEPVTVVMPRIIAKERLSAGAICDAIIQDVSQERPSQSLEAKARQIERLLSNASRAGQHHVLVIEEAHDLAISTIKYLKRFWEIEDGFRRLLAIILIGQPELGVKLDERVNWDAREVIRRLEVAELKPLDDHLGDYISFKFKRVGKELSDLFEADAFDAIRNLLILRGEHRGKTYERRNDYPLGVHNVVVKAMNKAAELGAPKIDAEVVQEVGRVQR